MIRPALEGLLPPHSSRRELRPEDELRLLVVRLQHLNRRGLLDESIGETILTRIPAHLKAAKSREGLLIVEAALSAILEQVGLVEQAAVRVTAEYQAAYNRLPAPRPWARVVQGGGSAPGNRTLPRQEKENPA